MMNKVCKEIANTFITSITRRSFYNSRRLYSPGAYEGEGKTTVQILNNEADLGLMINGYSQVGFRLNNNITILGSMVIFSRSVLSWQVDDISEVNEDSFSLFSVIEPKLDMIVLGTGDRIENFNVLEKILPFSRKYKIPVEVLPTEQATATFNFLNSEGRNVVGAMIPPKNFIITEDDELQSKLRYQDLYKIEYNP